MMGKEMPAIGIRKIPAVWARLGKSKYSPADASQPYLLQSFWEAVFPKQSLCMMHITVKYDHSNIEIHYIYDLRWLAWSAGYLRHHFDIFFDTVSAYSPIAEWPWTDVNCYFSANHSGLRCIFKSLIWNPISHVYFWKFCMYRWNTKKAKARFCLWELEAIYAYPLWVLCNDFLHHNWIKTQWYPS